MGLDLRGGEAQDIYRGSVGDRRNQNTDTDHQHEMAGYGRILFSAVAMVLLCRASSTPIDETVLQDMAYLKSLQNLDGSVWNDEKLRELYEIALATGQDPEVMEDLDNPITAKVMAILKQHVKQQADKRASYMSLCHFKICNMGRKRTPWNMWSKQ